MKTAPNALVDVNNDPLNTGDLNYDPYQLNVGNDTDTGAEKTITTYFYDGKWQKTPPTDSTIVSVDSAVNDSEENAKFIGEFTKADDVNYLFNVLKNMDFTFYIDNTSGNARPVMKVEVYADTDLLFSITKDYGTTTNNNPIVLTFSESLLNNVKGKAIKFKVYAWANGSNGFGVIIGNHDGHISKVDIKADVYTTREWHLLFDILGEIVRDWHLKFDVVDDTIVKDWHLKFDVIGATLGEDSDFTIYVNGTEIPLSLVSNVKIRVIAYTPESQSKPMMYIRFKSPREFNLDDKVVVKSKYSTFQAYITQKIPDFYNAIWEYEAYLPKQNRISLFNNFDSLVKNSDLNFILGNDENLWGLSDDELLSIDKDGILLTPDSFAAYITNISAPSKVYGLWEARGEAWYKHNELTERLFDSTNGQQTLTNLKFDKDEGQKTSVKITDYPSQTVAFERDFDKVLYAKAISYISVRFTTNDWNIWNRNTDVVRIRLEGTDEAGNMKFGDIIAQVPYSEGRIQTDYGWNKQPWVTIGGYLGNGLNNTFKTNDTSLDWWVKKIVVILYPLTGDVVVDGIFIKGNGTAKNYVGSGNVNVQTVNLESTDYDNAMKELNVDFTRLQVQEGYRFSIPLRLSFVPPFYFGFNGKNLKVFSVEHNIDQGITSFSVGMGLPRLTRRW